MSNGFQIVAVTDRKLCVEPLPTRVAKLCVAGVDRVIVREKGLTEREYAQLIDDILEAVAPAQRKNITVNTFADIAQEKGIVSVQLPIRELEVHSDFIHEFATVGVSVHSLAEARQAQKLEANFAMAGHIFATDCKPSIEPRGLDFLAEVCRETAIPIYAIGGIDRTTIAQVKEAGASGACLMSALMTCEDSESFIQKLRAEVGE